MKRDDRNLAVTTESDTVIDGINRFTSAFMAGRETSFLLPLAISHPECALLQLYAAVLYVYTQSTSEIDRSARPFLARAQALRSTLTEREQLLIDAVQAWSTVDFSQAIAVLEHIAAQWPRDIFAAKIAEFLFFQAPDYPRHLHFMERIAPAHAGYSHFLAMHAFALELNRDYVRTEAVARAAVDLDLYTPWAHHALAHLFLNQGRIQEGITVLEALAPTWAQNGHTTRAHNRWHLALLHLANGDTAGALRTFKHEIWGFVPDDSFEHVDAISLLWRLELAGQPVETEWHAIAPHIVARAADRIFPFLNAHYIYALVRAGLLAEATTALARLRASTDAPSDRQPRLWREIGLPLIEGCFAFARGDYAGCARLLAPLQDDLACVGGSDAQNDLFRMTFLVSLLKTRQATAAADVLARRIGDRAPTALEQRWRVMM